MTKISQEVLLERAIALYTTRYGDLTKNATAEILNGNSKFMDFYIKFERAFRLYEEGGYSNAGRIYGHLRGIDFNHDVEILTLKPGDTLVQTQVAWGATGNYYGFPDSTPDTIGISPVGTQFVPSDIPRGGEEQHVARQKEIATGLTRLVGENPSDYDSIFTPLPRPSSISKDILEEKNKLPPVIVPKKQKTFEVLEGIRVIASISAPIVDNWTFPNDPSKNISLPGGGKQLFIPPREKDKVHFLDFGIHDKINSDDKLDDSHSNKL